MYACAVKSKEKSRVVTVKNSWRLSALFRIEKIIREVGQDARAKRMGICGNTIFVKTRKGDVSTVLYEPQVRCKDRVCPVCNSYRASILSRKVEILDSDYALATVGEKESFLSTSKLTQVVVREKIGVPGFEPGQIEPESIVLPLHNTPIILLFYFISL